MIHSRATLVRSEANRFVCSIDPITLTGLALAAGVGGLGTAAATGAFSSKGAAATPNAPAPPPQAAPPQQAAPAKTTGPTNQPSFLGAAATPPVQSGQKTLLGQ